MGRTVVTARRILVTGGTGYVGAPTVNWLKAFGHDVHLLGRRDCAVEGVECHSADLLGQDDLRPLLRDINADIMLHLAWSVAPGKFWTDLQNLEWVGASLRLFRAFTEAGGRRIVGVGTCAEYDWSVAPLVEQSSPLMPHSLYGEAKASLWRMTQMLGRQEGVEIGWARLFFMYGPGEPRGKLVADTICSLLEGRRVATTEGGQLRDFMHVDDVGRALAQLAGSDVMGAINIASGEAIPVRNLLQQIEHAAGVHGLIDFGARPLAPGEPLSLACDIGRLKDELGFLPGFSLETGVEDTVRWWSEHQREIDRAETQL